jgi:hypothetical protein
MRGIVILNDSKFASVNNASPFRQISRGKIGENFVAAQTVTESEHSGFWKFDFAEAHYFVPGSIEVLQGQVLQLDAHSVAFRMRGIQDERIHFKFVLLP